MHYNIRYGELPPNEAQAKAIADIREYVGDECFEKINSELIASRDRGWCPTLDGFCLTLFLFPVSGYPLQAWYNEIFPYG